MAREDDFKCMVEGCTCPGWELRGEVLHVGGHRVDGVRHPSPREGDRIAVSLALQEIRMAPSRGNAADQLDRILKRLASRIDPHDTDESVERVENQLHAAISDAVVWIARSNGVDVRSLSAGAASLPL